MGGDDGNGETPQRVADDDDVAVALQGALDDGGVLGDAGVRVLARELGGHGVQSPGVEQRDEAVPTPGTVVSAMDTSVIGP